MDPSSDEMRPGHRVSRQRAALGRLLGGVPDYALANAMERCLSAYVPNPQYAPSYFGSGILWLGMDVLSHGIAVYITARWGAFSTRWARALDWVAQIVGSEAALALEPLQSQTEIASIGIEGSSLDNLVAKLYFRLRSATLLSELPLRMYDDEKFRQFLSIAMAGHAIRRSGLVLSVSLDTWSGSIAGQKIDICAHCTPRTPSEWTELVNKLTHTFDVRGFQDAERSIERGAAEVAFIGFGIRSDGSHRVNLYIRATEERATSRKW